MFGLIQRFTVFVCAVVALASACNAGTVAGGFGAIGDSFADEYQFYPPDRSQARNFVEILAATRGLNFGTFTTANRGTPRNQGFAYDWALSGATSNDLPAQTAGLAQQIAAGKVDTSFMFIGGNDFINAAESSDPATTIAAVPQNLLTNVLTSADTLLAANPKSDVVISNVFDITQVPATKLLIQAGLFTQAEANALSQAIDGYNAALAAQVGMNPRLALVDLNGQSKSLVSKPTFTIDGQTINTMQPGDDYHNLFLADGLHIGTVGQGLLANGYIAAADKQFNAGIVPLSDHEIVSFAQGVKSLAIPLPTAWVMGASGLLMAAGMMLMRSRRVRKAA